ncbi:hypothetical protein EM20IM_01780 [Candidatus Methylacidiphilum infernorum]|uniref:Uncharacterized protein n=1 Tax=Candidatus Methylacidiphilum infernorum TaxID=511746 RepID=A0ABX7PVR0_9BACT|nr:hypothetical protein [Candidatus Methylacidiphilum infernorum]QSR87105.1 hypothetical protein EM20IM_01780 [Candidatus Methylacidiphilum infernorum]
MPHPFLGISLNIFFAILCYQKPAQIYAGFSSCPDGSCLTHSYRAGLPFLAKFKAIPDVALQLLAADSPRVVKTVVASRPVLIALSIIALSLLYINMDDVKDLSLAPSVRTELPVGITPTRTNPKGFPASARDG